MTKSEVTWADLYQEAERQFRAENKSTRRIADIQERALELHKKGWTPKPKVDAKMKMALEAGGCMLADGKYVTKKEVHPVDAALAMHDLVINELRPLMSVTVSAPPSFSMKDAFVSPIKASEPFTWPAFFQTQEKPVEHWYYGWTW